MPYQYKDLLSTYASVGVEAGKTVFVTSDLGRVSDYELEGREALLEAHYRALRELLGETGTLVVPTASLNICNTDVPFDLRTTPSYRIGAFSEYVRSKPEAVRSFHPFVSYTAIGDKAKFICENCSRYTYGPMTPEARLIELDALSVCVGRPPNVTCSTAHHVEQVMAVPYRYTKEYLHPIIRDGVLTEELFYQYVQYQNSDVERCQNQRIFNALAGRLTIEARPLGRGKIWSYSIADFYREALSIFNDDIYIWCARTPSIRPWQK